MGQEVNDAAILDQVREEWQKIGALILFKAAGPGVSVVVTVEDMLKYQAAGLFFATIGHPNAIEFKLVTRDEADRLMAHNETLKGQA